MTRHVLVPSSILIFAAGMVLAAAQSGTAPAAAPPKTPVQTTGKAEALTLSGCIEAGETDDQLTLVDASDSAGGAKYRLSGTDVKRYLGKRVKITGGLMPSPNMAAQAGAVDPSTAATAARGGSTAATGGDTATLEFRVRRVVPVSGKCPPASKPQK